MKRSLILASSVMILASFAGESKGTASEGKASYELDPVPAARVRAALASDPAVGTRGTEIRTANKILGQWEKMGKVPGNVLLEETFTDESWKKNWVGKAGKTEWINDGRGGKCMRIHPTKGDNTRIEMPVARRLPIDVTHPIGVIFEARTPERYKPPFCRIDFYDKDGNSRGCYQFRAVTDVTQPQIFQRNGHLVQNIPPGTASMTVMFPVGGIDPTGKRIEKPGDIDNVRIVDLADAVSDYLSKGAAQRERAAAGEKEVLVYSDDSLTASYPVMPTGDDVPGSAKDTLTLRECAGEKTRSTAILWSKSAYKNVTVAFSDMTLQVKECVMEKVKGFFGLGPKAVPVIPAANWTAKVVKPHYQAIGAPNLYMVQGEGQTLVPELLLNDDTLVVPEYATQRNLVKYQWAGKSWYVDINDAWTQQFNTHIPAEKMPIVDAKTLQPFDLPARQNKQLALRVAVPADAKSGVYAGKITFRAEGVVVATLPVTLEVLPFALPKSPETIYDDTRVYTMGLYCWLQIADPDMKGDRISVNRRSRRQVLAEMKTLVDNGITSPALIWLRDAIDNDDRLREHLAVAREAGLKDNLYLAASGTIGNPTKPAELEALKKRIVHVKSVAREYGFNEVFFYGFDEAVGDRLVSQIPAWKAVREAGGKTIVSGYRDHLEKVGPYLDLCIYADDPESAQVEKWHALGQRVWKYNTPQCGPEDPGLFRRNYGLGNWMSGFDGANTYCDWGASAGWNDMSDGVRRVKLGRQGGGSRNRTIACVYATIDGVVETLALTGFDSAIKDVRYMALFRKLLKAHPDAAAQAWFDNLKPYEDDPARVRRETIDWILKLSK